ncbi:hypothetical protein BD779DRAFT_1477025 [Infundibulicybe gibba]|nr:hypothetical protein BD779DRAFT_1477025 [Infundibulicybe gibba]
MAPTVRGVEWAYTRTSEADHGAELAGGPKLNRQGQSQKGAPQWICKQRAGVYARTSKAGQGAKLAGGPKPNGCTQLGNTGFANNGGQAKQHVSKQTKDLSQQQGVWFPAVPKSQGPAGRS